VKAAEREGAALKEELARCRETRKALLKRWHEARIDYSEVRFVLGALCVSPTYRSPPFLPFFHSLPPSLNHSDACTPQQQP
jgi:hypothetical protein